MEQRDVLARISDEYYDLTDAERKVADYVSVHRGAARLMSISELAEASGVAEATVSRFCRRLGYAGYGAFKLAVAGVDAAPEGPAPGGEDGLLETARRRCAAESEAISRTLALLDPERAAEAADILSGAARVLCMGQGGSLIMAMEAAHLFSELLPDARAVGDFHLQSMEAAKLTDRDAVLFFSYSGSTRETVELLPQVRERGAKLVLVTRFPRSPAAAWADVVLQCGANEQSPRLDSVPARVSQLFLLDVLLAEVSRRGGRVPGAESAP